MSTELPFWQSLARKAITDFLESAVAVFAAINLAVFAQYLTVTANGVEFDRAGAVDEIAVLAPAVVIGLCHAAISALRRQYPKAKARVAGYWTRFLAWARG